MNIRAKIFGSGEADETPILGTKKPRGAEADKLNSIAVPREEKRRANTRGDDRHRLSEEVVRVSHRGKTREAQLINLSGGGAMIEANFELKLWDRVDLHLGEEGVIECAVRWLKGNRAGLEFAHETRIDCSADERTALLRETISRSFGDIEFEAAASVQPEPAPKAAEPDSEHRRARRHPLIWSAVLHHDYQSTPVRLRNISSTGAAIECTDSLRLGAEPLLDFGEAGTVFATVTWVVGDQAGLKFHSEYDLSQLAKSRPQVAPARWDKPGYLEGAAAAPSPWDKQWGRLSIGELRDELEGYMKR